MLSENEILKKLYEQPKIFYEHMAKKEYAQASYCAQTARAIAVFIELNEEQLIELFGTRQYDEPIEGLFREESVMKADEWCIFHNKTLRELTLAEKAERERVWRMDNGGKRVPDAIKRYR